MILGIIVRVDCLEFSYVIKVSMRSFEALINRNNSFLVLDSKNDVLNGRVTARRVTSEKLLNLFAAI